jgi:hypothetical protein
VRGLSVSVGRAPRRLYSSRSTEIVDSTLIELAAWMIFRLIGWLPHHRFRLVADGAYASVLRYEFPRTAVITRIRRDAALYDLAPPRTGRRGRPRNRASAWPRRSAWPPPSPTPTGPRSRSASAARWSRQALVAHAPVVRDRPLSTPDRPPYLVFSYATGHWVARTPARARRADPAFELPCRSGPVLQIRARPLSSRTLFSQAIHSMN